MVNFDRMIKIEVEILFLISISQFVCKWLKKQKIEPVLWIKYTKPFFLKVLAARLTEIEILIKVSFFPLLTYWVYGTYACKVWEEILLRKIYFTGIA